MNLFSFVLFLSQGFYGDTILVDPTLEEEIMCQSAPPESSPSTDHGLITQATLPQHDQVSEFFLVGSVDLDGIKRAIDTLNRANKDICPIIQQCLVKTVLRAFKRKKHEDNEIKE